MWILLLRYICDETGQFGNKENPDVLQNVLLLTTILIPNFSLLLYFMFYDCELNSSCMHINTGFNRGVGDAAICVMTILGVLAGNGEVWQWWTSHMGLRFGAASVIQFQFDLSIKLWIKVLQHMGGEMKQVVAEESCIWLFYAEKHIEPRA